VLSSEQGGVSHLSSLPQQVNPLADGFPVVTIEGVEKIFSSIFIFIP